jgi:hypothetical protein
MAEQARAVGQGLRQRLNFEELTSRFGNRIKTGAGAPGTAKAHVARKKVLTEEPMAGYGA